MPLPWPASAVKSALAPREFHVRRVLSGPLAGALLDLDLTHHTQVWLGLYEVETKPWLRRLSRGIRTALDVGSADGWYTIYFLKKTSAARVMAFEPDPAALDVFRRNLILNGAEGFEPSATLVGSRDGAGTTTLDSHLPEISFPCLVKVDVEGAELAVLEGAARLLAAPGVSWMVEIHSADMETRCRDRLEAEGYVVHTVHKAWWRAVVREKRPLPVNHWLIAVRPD